MYLRQPSFVTRFVFSAAGLSLASACAPVLETGPNAVGVYVQGASGDTTSLEADADEIRLQQTTGVGASYSRRLAGGRSLWLGPEAILANLPESELASPRVDIPAGVSRLFAAGLLQLNVYPDIEDFRIGFDFGVGVAYGRWSESQRLVDGKANPQPRVDHGVGPVLGFGMNIQITKHVVVRLDVYILFFKPELSFPWPERSTDNGFGRAGVAIVF